MISPDPTPARSPLVSVVIPCRNHGAYLSIAVASVQAQDHQSWECIIVDDGSIDGSAEIAAALAARDTRIRLHRQPPRGLSAARNAGLHLARGEYVQFLDADDVIAPTKFSIQLAALVNASRPALAYCDYSLATAGDAPARPASYLSPRLAGARPVLDLAARWEKNLSIPAHCFLFDRQLFSGRAIRFDEALPSHEDWDCWMEIFRAEPTVRYVDMKLATYVIRADSICSNRSRMRRGFLQALRKQQEHSRDDQQMRVVLTAKLADVRRAYRDCSRVDRIRYLATRSLFRLGARLLPSPACNLVRVRLQTWLRTRGWSL